MLQRHRFSQAPAPMTVGWLEKLDRCPDEKALLGAVRDYMALLSPGELTVLPKSCSASKLADAQDIPLIAMDLLMASTSRDASPLVQRVANFMAAASVRLSRLTKPKAANDTAGDRLSA